MADPVQQQIEAARQQEQALTYELAQLDEGENTLDSLRSYLAVVSSAYKIIMNYQEGSVAGRTGVVLNEAVLKAYDPLEKPSQNPISTDVLAFNSYFQQIYEMFNILKEILANNPQLYDQTRIPNIVNVVNEIRRIRSSFSDDDWQAVRIQRNFMAYNYPHLPPLWKFAWDPLKRIIEPVGLAARDLLITIPPILQQLADLKTTKAAQLANSKKTIAELSPITWTTVVRGRGGVRGGGGRGGDGGGRGSRGSGSGSRTVRRGRGRGTVD